MESRRSPEELAHLGAEVFDRRVRPVLRPEDDNTFVAIDVGSGDYEIDEDDYAAVSRLRGRRPSAEVWLERAGHPAAYRLGRGRHPPLTKGGSGRVLGEAQCKRSAL